jgi:hypothetical protein
MDLKNINAGATQDFRTYIKENYRDKGKGNLSHLDVY